MRLLTRLLSLAATIVAAASLAAPAQAASGVLRISCLYSHSRQADPIVSPGVYPSAHLHDFYGNTSTNENSTLASLQAAPANCKGEPMNHSAYWVPSVYLNGVKRPAPTLTVYYSRQPGGQATETVPQGLKLLSGDAHATGPTVASEWSCFGASTPHLKTPYDCSPYKNGTKPSTVQATIRFPSCWDGKGLNPTDLAFAGNRGVCPTGYPHILPHIRETLETDIVNPLGPGGSVALTLSSGPYYTIHADAFEGWIQSRIDALLRANGVCSC